MSSAMEMIYMPMGHDVHLGNDSCASSDISWASPPRRW